MILFRPALLSLGLILGVLPATGQIGDSGDKKGETQKPLVPAELIPPAPARTAEEELKTFQLMPGFCVEIAAADPLVQEPVAIAFGTDGRMWVVEMRGYMGDLDGNGEDLPVGRVVVLRDRDGDGRYDDSTVFVDGLVLPRAIALVGDGALIGAPPELVYWRDTDGDGKADTRTVVATDYGVRVDPKRPHLANPERAPNSPLWAYDNWIYSTAYVRKFRYVRGAFEAGATSFRGQWGLSQDDFGRFYYGSNSDQTRVDLALSDYLQRNPNYPRLSGLNFNAAVDQFVWPARVNPGINRGYRPEMLRDGKLKEFTAACAPYIYRGDLFPQFYGNAFVAEPSANFVRRNVVEPVNGQPRAKNAYDKSEFLASTDERFRPVNFMTGPDGALYVVDLYRGVLQHRISLTSYLRKQSEDRNLANPQHLGRIFRIVPEGRPAPRATQIAVQTNAQWVQHLSHANAWWRETAQRLLVERRDEKTIPAVRQIATSGAPLGRVHALWTLEGMEALDRATIANALKSDAPVVLTAAIRLSERFFADDKSGELTTRLLALAREGAPEVKYQAVLSLGNRADAGIDRALADVVRAATGNAVLRDGFYSGLHGRELPLFEKLAADSNWAATDADANAVLSGLARGIFASRELAAVEKLLAIAGKSSAVRAGEILNGMVAGASGSKRRVTFQQEPAGLAPLRTQAATRQRLGRLEPLLDWPGKPGAATAAVAPLTAEEQARFVAGKALFTNVCAACHQITGRGLDGLAPPLLDSEWVLGPPDRPIKIVLQGVRGNLVVLGRTHTGDMPAFGAVFDDTQIASVLTYLRREWGHEGSPVDPAFVAKIRAETAGQKDAWSQQELQGER
ncbi:MAG TPA: c-type cytochrome [Opitutaceae bacterium]|nr:c-type cytochrome [Opitutaceae bacterium]